MTNAFQLHTESVTRCIYIHVVQEDKDLSAWHCLAV